MGDIHPVPSPDMVMADRGGMPGPTPDLSGQCDSAPQRAYDAPGMPTPVSPDSPDSVL